MLRNKLCRLAIAIWPLVASGCGGSSATVEPGIMEETQHSHYHVHAVDASHGHTHPGLDAFGGHTHPHAHLHRHSDNEAHM
jgi:hypothetical protein